MQVIYSPKHAGHDGGMELHRGELVPCFETPSRADYILDAVKAAGFSLSGPQAFPMKTLFRVHDKSFVEFLRTAHDAWQAEGREGFMLPGVFPARGMRRDRIPESLHGRMGYYAFDASTPIVKGTWEAALAAAECALTAAAQLVEGKQSSYALCRPPGHHAGRAMYGGYCFLNNAALAAQYLRDNGFAKVAVLDVDYHHGNGTQEIFQDRDDVLFVSIHGEPDTEYPFYLGYADETGEGAGLGFTRNFPLPRGTGWNDYREALDAACETIVKYSPDALVASLGVDTFEGDPISSFRITSENFSLLGEQLAVMHLPTVLVQEGGYAVEAIGRNVAAMLAAFRS